MLIDPYGRSINYLRISLTDRCNLRCVYCMPAGGLRWTPLPDLLSDNEIVCVAETAARLGMNKIRLTGGEPLLRPGVVELVRRLAAMPGIHDIGLTTNATLLEKMAEPLAQAGLKRINISLDTLERNKFRRMTRFGDFDRAWNGILAAERAGLTPLKLNTVVVRGLNDYELPALARLTIKKTWHIRFIEIMPIGNTQDWGEGFPVASERYVPVQEMRARLTHLDLQPVTHPSGDGPARTFRIPGALGTVGFISPLGEHFCQDCNRLRLTANGALRSCLVQPDEILLRDALNRNQRLDELFFRAVARKPQRHNMLATVVGTVSGRSMSQLGG
ncbi:MAG: GTP 3',8-cyclase MoaA [Anaerolineales bacterium]